jgi:type I restriction enzyme R subunit
LGNEDNESEDEEEDYEEVIRKEIESRGKQKHISFFGFTGTPKPKTLELFGRRTEDGKFVPFHTYSMKQSIYEGFTLDVLEHYTTYKRYFKILKTSEEDRELPEGKVKRELVNFVDSHSEVIRQKVSIILNHFIRVTSKKINGRGRGMVVVRSRKHCVLFQQEMKKQMREMNLSYSCLVGYSGSIFHDGLENTEISLNKSNGTEVNDIPTSFKDPRYRILIVSNKFQTGFDEPLLHSMYIDKKLGGVQCVQTLSRLNRTKTGKTDTFILDFANDSEEIVSSFQPYYTTTQLTGETEPDKLYDLEYKIESFHLYTQDQIERFCMEFYKKTETDQRLHPIIDEVIENWKMLESDELREDFKSDIQSFCRLYSYISQITTFTEVRWEKLFVFLKFLNKKLPKREGEKIKISDSVDLDSLRIQMIGESKLYLEERIGELNPMSDSGGSYSPEDKELLSQIIKRVNDIFGVDLNEEDKVDLKNISSRMVQNAELESIMVGNNTEDDKKDFFSSMFKDLIGDYYGDRLEFYKKVIDPKIFPMIIDGMYQEYRRNKKL